MNWIKSITSKTQKLAIDSKKLRQFHWLIVFAISIFVGISFYSDGFTAHNVVSFFLLLLLSILGFMFSWLYRSLLFFWLFFGFVMNEISSTLILGMVYYLIFFPITFLIRIFIKNEKTVGWMDHEDRHSDYEKMF